MLFLVSGIYRYKRKLNDWKILHLPILDPCEGDISLPPCEEILSVSVSDSYCVKMMVSNTRATLSISDLPALVLVQWLINSKTQRTTILNIKKMLKLGGFFNHMINFRDLVRNKKMLSSLLHGYDNCYFKRCRKNT